MEIEKPHDKYFKNTFGDENVARNFLNHYLPEAVLEAVDTNTLKPQKDSFISKDLEERFSDLLYKADINGEEGYFYFLFEHKSQESRDIFFQLIRYMSEIWIAKMAPVNNWEPPLVIPLVIYQGERKWTIPKRLGDILRGYHYLNGSLKKYVPDFEYLFYDLTDNSSVKSELDAKLMIYLRVIQAFSKAKQDDVEKVIIEIKQYFRLISDKNERERFLVTTMTYVFNVAKELTEGGIRKMSHEMIKEFPEGSEVIMTLAEQLMEKGKIEGRTEALADTAIQLLGQRFGRVPEPVQKGISQLDKNTLESIIGEILQFESLDDVKKYLG